MIYSQNDRIGYVRAGRECFFYSRQNPAGKISYNNKKEEASSLQQSFQNYKEGKKSSKVNIISQVAVTLAVGINTYVYLILT